MNKIILSLAFMSCFIFNILACTTISYAQTKAFTFEVDSVYMGRMSSDNNSITYSFDFQTNTYAPVTIKTVDTDCSCTVASYPKQPLKKGDNGTVKVVFTPYKAGAFKKVFTVKINELKEEYRLVIEGFLSPEHVTPETKFPYRVGNLNFRHKVINFGTVNDKGTLIKTIYFYNNNDYPISFDKAPVTPKHIAVSFEKVTEIPPRSEGSFLLYYKPEERGTKGYVVDNIRLFTNDSTMTYFDIPVSVSIIHSATNDEINNPDRPKISIFNKTVDLGKIRLAGYRIVSIQLVNNGKTDLQIHKVETELGCELMSIESETVKPYQTANINIKFKDTGKKGRQERKITILSNDPAKPTQKVTIKANVL